nr:hypothetical protein [Tanacetum cinerariifolium]
GESQELEDPEEIPLEDIFEEIKNTVSRRISKGESSNLNQKAPIELSQVNKDQAIRIKELEDELAKKDTALVYDERINADMAQEKEKLVAQLSKTEMEKFDCIRKLLPTVAGWAKGLSEEHSEEDLLELMSRMENFDAYADKKMYVEYENCLRNDTLSWRRFLTVSAIPSMTCSSELSQVNKDQVIRIKELEDELAKKDTALVYDERINADRAQEKEKLVAQLSKTEMEKFDCIRKLLPTVVNRLFQSHEYKESLSGPFNLAIQAGWAKGLVEEHSEEDLLELMSRMENFDAYADKKMYVEYENCLRNDTLSWRRFLTVSAIPSMTCSRFILTLLFSNELHPANPLLETRPRPLLLISLRVVISYTLCSLLHV